MNERLYHEITCPSLTKTGPCSCQPVIVADAPAVTPAPPIRPAAEDVFRPFGPLPKAAIVSAIAFIEQTVEPRRCDHEAVAECVRCTAVAVARWLQTAIAHIETESATVARLTAEREDLTEALTCVLEEKPLPNGQYVHLVYCNSDRYQPAGTRGVTCNCKVGTARAKKAEAEVARLTARGQQLVERIREMHGEYHADSMDDCGHVACVELQAALPPPPETP